MRDVSEAVRQAENLQKKIRILFVVFVLLVLLAVVCMYFGRPMFYGVTIAAIVFYLFILRRMIRKYASDFTENRIRFGLGEPFSELKMHPGPLWRQEEMAAFRMLPLRREAGSLLCRHGFRAKWKGRTLEGAEITLHYPAKKAEGTKDFRFLSGTLFALDVREVPGRDILILSSRLLEPEAEAAFLKENRYGEICWEDGWREDGFRVYCRGERGPEGLRTAAAVRLLGQTGAKAVLRLMPGKLLVYLNNCFYSQGVVRPRVRVTAAMLRLNPLPGRDAVLSLFEMLK